jgi:hypothetical protein
MSPDGAADGDTPVLHSWKVGTGDTGALAARAECGLTLALAPRVECGPALVLAPRAECGLPLDRMGLGAATDMRFSSR